MSFKIEKNTKQGTVSVRRRLKVPTYKDVLKAPVNGRRNRGAIVFDNKTSSLYYNNGKNWLLIPGLAPKPPFPPGPIGPVTPP